MLVLLFTASLFSDRNSHADVRRLPAYTVSNENAAINPEAAPTGFAMPTGFALPIVARQASRIL